ncbi:hypothetical protein QAD02_021906 [Eretmocerus hayati]|uniref:Uncharacterized protein n=1 Tax=Eretmocerus hayati TaxID=131215 RepID=A0ACC2PUQ7_9HYME|nr:hypothetical protein QAD02_021906 [Eretmocerus hayati]
MNMIDDGLHGGDKKKCHDVWINDRQIRLDSDDETNTACPRRDKRQNKETLNGTPGTTDGSQTDWTLKHDGHVDAISSGKIIYEEMPANNKQTDELVLGNVETIRDLRRRNLLDSPKHLLEDCQLVDKISGDLSDLFNLRSGIDGDDATFENQIDTRSEQDIEVFCKENICGKCQDPSDVGKRGDLILFDGFCERCEDKMNSPMIEDIGGLWATKNQIMVAMTTLVLTTAEIYMLKSRIQMNMLLENVILLNLIRRKMNFDRSKGSVVRPQ